MDNSRMDTKEGAQKLDEVARELHRILNSTMFRDLVFKMGPKPGERSVWRTASNKEIYDRIMSGAEETDETTDNSIDLVVDDYYSPMRVIGYMVRGKKGIFVNKKYFNTRSNKMVGSNLIHEYGHHIGFSHDFKRTPDRPTSIAYQLNKIYEQCHDRIIGNVGSLVRVKVGGWWLWSRYEWRRVYD